MTESLEHIIEELISVDLRLWSPDHFGRLSRLPSDCRRAMPMYCYTAIDVTGAVRLCFEITVPRLQYVKVNITVQHSREWSALPQARAKVLLSIPLWDTRACLQ